MDHAKVTLRAAASKPAQRLYVGTVLYAISSIVLLGIAIVSYWAFYYSFVPQIGFEKVIHLQFSESTPPYGIATFPGELVSNQPYDVVVSLDLPRSPPNIATGNFMLNLDLLDSSTTAVVQTSRRPAILTYKSRVITLASILAQSPLLTLGWRKEAELLHVPMMEGVTFERGWNSVPVSLKLELQAAERMQVYRVWVKFSAKLSGLRYIMYNYRLISFVVFSSLFWTIELLSAGVALLLLSIFLPSGSFSSSSTVKNEEGKDSAIKQEESESDTLLSHGELSDTPRSFPTFSNQPPLRSQSSMSTSPKRERRNEDDSSSSTKVESGRADKGDRFEHIAKLSGAPQDGEDSGIGTSVAGWSSSGSNVQRRAGLGPKKEDDE